MMTRTPYYKVTVEGEDITAWVSSVQVVEDDRQADSVSISIPDPRMVFADALMEGCHVQADLGYAEKDQHALLIKAMITKVDVSYTDGGIPGVKLSGEDKSIEMGLTERTKLWSKTTVGAIVRRIGQSYGFSSVSVRLSPDPKVVAEHQDGKTDLAFLQDLAKTYHAKCFVELDESDQEVLYFIPERRVVTLRRPDTLVLRYRQGPGSTLQSFSPSFDASYLDRMRDVKDVGDKGDQLKSPPEPPAEVVMWSLPQDLEARVRRGDFARLNALFEAGAGHRKELQAKLAARRPSPGRVARTQADLDATSDVLESRRLGMSATGSTFGSIWLRAKSNVLVAGVHERFAGQWYVTKVTHTIDTGGYRTEFSCVR
jgi:phage protein D